MIKPTLLRKKLNFNDNKNHYQIVLTPTKDNTLFTPSKG